MATDVLDYRVKLREKKEAWHGESRVVVFEATPELVETRNVNYKTVDPTHAPGQIYAYVNTASRTFNLSGIKLISRTQQEAQRNLGYLQTIRSWTMPAFGQDPLTSEQRENREFLERDYRRGTSGQALRQAWDGEDFGTDLRGQPPRVLLLSAYSTESRLGSLGHINQIPVVIQNISIPYPADIDYIPALSGEPMPTILTIDMTLAETHSAREYENFSLKAYKDGKLRHF